MGSSVWKRLISPQASRLWGLPFTITILLILFNLLGPGFTSAHKQAVQAASVAQPPVPGQLFCLTGHPCERILTNQTNYNVNGTSVTILESQEWQASYQLAYPIAGRVGPLGVHHALGSVSTYDSICKADSQLCTNDLNKDGQMVEGTLNSMYACAGQPAPFPTTALPENSSVLPLAYHVSPPTRVVLAFLSFLAIDYITGVTFTTIQVFPLSSKLAQVALGGLVSSASSLAYIVATVAINNAVRANNGQGPVSIIKTWMAALLLWLLGAPPDLLPRANAQCFARAQTKVAQRLCPYPFPPAYAKAEAQMCYPGEQLFPN